VVRVVAAAIIEKGCVLACQRPSGHARGGTWELPGGKVEPGETDVQALVRELREELLVTIDVGPRLGAIEHDYADISVRLVAYGCTLREGAPVAVEHAALRWLRADELDAVPWSEADRDLVEAVRSALRGE